MSNQRVKQKKEKTNKQKIYLNNEKYDLRADEIDRRVIRI